MSVLQEMRRMARQKLGDDENLAAEVARVYSHLIKGKGEPELIEALMQFDEIERLNRPDLVDTYWFVQSYYKLQEGSLAIAWIPTPTGPGPDRAGAANQHTLGGVRQNHPIIRAIKVTSGSGDSDGRVDIEATRDVFAVAIPGSTTGWRPVPLPAMSLPLEIGLTDPTTTANHIVRDGGLVRWAYGSERLYLIINTEHSATTF